jgi:hypothetical protein
MLTVDSLQLGECRRKPSENQSNASAAHANTNQSTSIRVVKYVYARH